MGSKLYLSYTYHFPGGADNHTLSRPILISNKGEKFEKAIDVCSTLLARDYKGFSNYPMNGVIEVDKAEENMEENNLSNKIRIRKLTPKEYFRLMGFPDEAIEAAQNVGVSNSQLYKQAGNSIVTNVLYYIYLELYKAMPYLFDDLKLTSLFSGIGAFEVALDRFYKDINSENFSLSSRVSTPVALEGEIIRLGNVSVNNSQAGIVYDTSGIFPTLIAGTHGYAAGYILEKDC